MTEVTTVLHKDLGPVRELRCPPKQKGMCIVVGPIFSMDELPCIKDFRFGSVGSPRFCLPT